MSAPRGIQYELERPLRDQIRREHIETAAAKVRCWTIQREAVDCGTRLENLAKKAGYGSLKFEPIPSALTAASRTEYETQTRALRERILDMESRWVSLSRPKATPLQAGNESPATRAERYLGQLDPAALLDDSMLQLRSAIDSATPERGHIFADRLQLLVGKANRELSIQRGNASQLNELESRIDALEGTQPELKLQLSLARAAVVHGGQLNVGQLCKDLERAENNAQGEAERVWVANKIQEGLQELGYTVSMGFDTIFAGADGLVRLTSWNHHALSVGVSSEEVSLEIVRTADEERESLVALRDREVETSWCKDFPLLLARLEKQGVVPGQVRAVPAGLSPARRIGEQKPERANRTAPLKRAKK